MKFQKSKIFEGVMGTILFNQGKVVLMRGKWNLDKEEWMHDRQHNKSISPFKNGGGNPRVWSVKRNPIVGEDDDFISGQEWKSERGGMGDWLEFRVFRWILDKFKTKLVYFVIA